MRIVKAIASTEWSYAPGEIVELPADLAEKWIASGVAARVEEDGVATADISPPERAVLRPRKR